jgi:hypothetical protein
MEITEIIPDDLPDWAIKAMAEGQLFTVTFERIKRLEAQLKPVCSICHGSGINHGVQCNPSKKHPTGWKSERCECQLTGE